MKNLKYIRIAVYISILILLCILKFTDASNFGECYINRNFGILCPSCGITRATKAILDLDFSLAISYNAYYVLVLLPIFSIFFVDDIICIFKKKKSLVEIILS